MTDASGNEFAPDPIAELQRWVDAAKAAGVVEPTAMCVATADARGTPSARMVLLRGLDARGLRFYTSYFSRKGRELAERGRIACVFWWGALERQVRVEGSVTQLSEEESDAYYQSRPRGHRLAAWASEQSEPVDARETLEERYAHFEQRFEGEDVPRPHSWGGYLVAPDRFEFWQGRPNRLHDRAEYTRNGALWTTRRLQP
jgi:pyridoxamine 5'-phosphate oxidase